MRTYTPKNAVLVPEKAEKVFDGEIFDIYQWQQELFDGSFATFEMAKRSDTVNVIAIRGGKIVVVNDEQPNRPARLSLPGGRHDDESETELDAVKREMLEETGMSFRTWKMVKCFEPIQATNKIEWFNYLFVAYDFESEVAPKLDAGEKIEVKYMSYEDYLGIEPTADGGAMKELFDFVRKAGSIDGVKNLPDISKV